MIKVRQEFISGTFYIASWADEVLKWQNFGFAQAYIVIFPILANRSFLLVEVTGGVSTIGGDAFNVSRLIK